DERRVCEHAQPSDPAAQSHGAWLKRIELGDEYAVPAFGCHAALPLSEDRYVCRNRESRGGAIQLPAAFPRRTVGPALICRVVATVSLYLRPARAAFSIRHTRFRFEGASRRGLSSSASARTIAAVGTVATAARRVDATHRPMARGCECGRCGPA